MWWLSVKDIQKMGQFLRQRQNECKRLIRIDRKNWFEEGRKEKICCTLIWGILTNHKSWQRIDESKARCRLSCMCDTVVNILTPVQRRSDFQDINRFQGGKRHLGSNFQRKTRKQRPLDLKNRDKPDLQTASESKR